MNTMTSKRARIEITVQWSTIDDAPAFASACGSQPPWRRLVTWLRECHERSRQRWYLQNLDDRLLRDIGLTPADVEAELRKWPWMK